VVAHGCFHTGHHGAKKTGPLTGGNGRGEFNHSPERLRGPERKDHIPRVLRDRDRRETGKEAWNFTGVHRAPKASGVQNGGGGMRGAIRKEHRKETRRGGFNHRDHKDHIDRRETEMETWTGHYGRRGNAGCRPSPGSPASLRAARGGHYPLQREPGGWPLGVKIAFRTRIWAHLRRSRAALRTVVHSCAAFFRPFEKNNFLVVFAHGHYADSPGHTASLWAGARFRGGKNGRDLQDAKGGV
jgi:hypothetical protein